MLDCKDGHLSLEIDQNNQQCNVCQTGKSCALYTFGTMMSRNRGVWYIRCHQDFAVGRSIQLKIEATTLFKLAIWCYGLPVAMFLGSAVLVQLLFATEWLTIVSGIGGLVLSYGLLKLGFRCERLPDIQLVQ